MSDASRVLVVDVVTRGGAHLTCEVVTRATVRERGAFRRPCVMRRRIFRLNGKVCPAVIWWALKRGMDA